ncbi:MAG: T9SS type A sorting domain-containing protein [Ignavibacteriaceae bacterium]
MYRYFSTFLLIVLMAFSGVFLTQAQNGKNGIPKKGPSNEMGSRTSLEKQMMLNESKNQNTLKPFATQVLKFDNVVGLIDTFSYRKWYPGDWSNGGTGFGHQANDVMVTWYKAPADLLVKAVGLGTNLNHDLQPASVKLVKLINYTAQDLADFSAGTSSEVLGLFPGVGDGYNDVAPYDFGDATGNSTGPWEAIDNHPIPWADLWSENGIGAPVVPTPSVYNPAGNNYDWILMSTLGEPTVLRDEIFGISVSNTGTWVAATDSVQSFYAQYGVEGSSPGLTYPTLKFYEYERTVPSDDNGWNTRPVALDLVAIVDIYGDAAPTISGVTVLSTTLSTDPQTVDATITDTNPGGGASGVQSATIKYSIDDGTTWSDATMTTGGGDLYTGDIPGQSPGTIIKYFVEAVDVLTNSSQSATYTYRIFAPTAGVNTLLVFNGLPDSGYPSDYYFGSGDWPNSYTTLDFDHDVWAYGSLTDALANSYTNILEIATDGPAVLNSSVIRTWIEGDGSRNYMLAGDEWLGAQTGWVDRTYSAGDFHFDILGINADHNDINYAASGDQGLPSVVYPQMGSLLGGPVYDLYTQISSDNGWTAPMAYDPTWEIGVDNWLDGVDFEADVQVDMQGLAIDSVTTYNIAGHRTLTAGNKIAFFGYDPLSISSDTETEAEYWWYGFTLEAPQVQVLDWFGISTGVENEDNLTPGTFSLSQNYPNPFNPSTTIKFSIPEASNVVLKVYDILGSEVAVLVNKEVQAGNYTVDFDATKFASGMYIYSITAGEFNLSKKMMLLK